MSYYFFDHHCNKEDRYCQSVPPKDCYYQKALISPDCNKSETNNSYIVTFDIPGVTKESLEVTVNGGFIAIKGDREGTQKFSTVREVPSDVDITKICSFLRNGVLEIVFPKVKPFHVKVQ